MSIRPIEPGDLDELVLLCAEHANFERSPFKQDGQAERLRQALFADPPRLFAWLLEIDGQAEGFASASLEYSTWQARDYLHLDCIYLSPAARGQGWGSKLLKAAATHAERMGCREMQWQTPPWNEKAIAFYEAKGARGLPKLRFSLPIESTPERTLE